MRQAKTAESMLSKMEVTLNNIQQVLDQIQAAETDAMVGTELLKFLWCNDRSCISVAKCSEGIDICDPASF